MASEHVIVALTADRKIVEYQIGRKIEKIRDVIFEEIVNFDVFDLKYFIVYREKNIIDVYTIDMQLYLKF